MCFNAQITLRGIWIDVLNKLNVLAEYAFTSEKLYTTYKVEFYVPFEIQISVLPAFLGILYLVHDIKPPIYFHQSANSFTELLFTVLSFAGSRRRPN